MAVILETRNLNYSYQDGGNKRMIFEDALACLRNWRISGKDV